MRKMIQVFFIRAIQNIANKKIRIGTIKMTTIEKKKVVVERMKQNQQERRDYNIN